MRRFSLRLLSARTVFWSVFLVWASTAWAKEPPGETNLTVGPKRGTLMIVGGGGGAVDEESGRRVSELLFRKFVELAGGPRAKIVILPTAMSSDPDFDYKNAGELRVTKGLRMQNVTVVHTHDPKVADTAEFCKPIEEADAVWFGGGRQWRFVDAYGGTRAEKAFRGVLDRGGAIGGSSAGATIQGSFLARGDTKGNLAMIGDHQRGFGYVTNCAIDQHVVARKRQKDLIELLTDSKGQMLKDFNRSALLGIGIDEDTAIIVRGNQFEVVGKDDGSVLVYDPRAWKEDTAEGEKYITLKKGAKYDLKRRAVLGKTKKAAKSKA